MRGTQRAMVLGMALLVAGIATSLGGATSARADTYTWDWFAYLSEMPKKSGCEGSGAPSQAAWNDALGNQAPSRDDVLFFGMAYPCGASPTRFLQARAWKNWYLFGAGTYSASWDGQPFTRLGNTATVLRGAGFWPDGPM